MLIKSRKAFVPALKYLECLWSPCRLYPESLLSPYIHIRVASCPSDDYSQSPFRPHMNISRGPIVPMLMISRVPMVPMLIISVGPFSWYDYMGSPSGAHMITPGGLLFPVLIIAREPLVPMLKYSECLWSPCRLYPESLLSPYIHIWVASCPSDYYKSKSPSSTHMNISGRPLVPVLLTLNR